MSNPEEFNLLNNVQHKMDIHKLPNTTYWIQSVFLPTVTLEGGILPTAQRDVTVPGHKLEFDPMTVTFLIDQDLKGYSDIYHWMLQIAVEKNYADMLSDVTLHFLTGQMNVSRSVTFVGCYPVSLTELSVNSDDSDAVQVVGNVIFNYQYFKFDNVEFPYNVVN